jgi:hypothetical protein
VRLAGIALRFVHSLTPCRIVSREALLLQILMNNLDELFSRQGLRSLAPGALIDHMFANMVFDYLGDESVQGAAAGSCLLEDIGALIIRFDGSFDRLDLTAQPFDAIQQFGFFLCNMTHGSKPLLHYYTGVGYITQAPPNVAPCQSLNMDPQPSTPASDADRLARLRCQPLGRITAWKRFSDVKSALTC